MTDCLEQYQISASHWFKLVQVASQQKRFGHSSQEHG